ncbi:response regulator [Desulfovibrio mangrovi]|uniref:response regulator n=1 Tax=Desulfovibrio mangrovi TaxID=2976983 RepID=UPI002245AA8B|nr:response regulator [Desulfovibrio mangrovi]UZP68937.1 response regulator [Desulfovibrio mangrovi]
MRILVIDDEMPTLKMFVLILNAMGHEVLTAESGEQGLEVLRAEHPPLVLTDIKMPGMDGIEVLQKIKEENQATEVIVITGHGDMDLAIKALNLDATDFINKPVRREALQGALARAEERIQLARSKAAAISIYLREGDAVIAVRGTLSTSSESALKDAFRHAARSRNNIVLDFAENTSINGAAISVLAECVRNARTEGQRIAMVGLSANFRQVFEVMGITRQIAAFASLDDVRF